MYNIGSGRLRHGRAAVRRDRPSGWTSLVPLAAIAIAASLMLAAPARAADCGPVPDAQPPLPPGTTLVWLQNAQGTCILTTQQYECAQASGEPC